MAIAWIDLLAAPVVVARRLTRGGRGLRLLAATFSAFSLVWVACYFAILLRAGGGGGSAMMLVAWGGALVANLSSLKGKGGQSDQVASSLWLRWSFPVTGLLLVLLAQVVSGELGFQFALDSPGDAVSFGRLGSGGLLVCTILAEVAAICCLVKWRVSASRWWVRAGFGAALLAAWSVLAVPHFHDGLLERFYGPIPQEFGAELGWRERAETGSVLVVLGYVLIWIGFCVAWLRGADSAQSRSSRTFPSRSRPPVGA